MTIEIGRKQLDFFERKRQIAVEVNCEHEETGFRLLTCFRQCRLEAKRFPNERIISHLVVDFAPDKFINSRIVHVDKRNNWNLDATRCPPSTNTIYAIQRKMWPAVFTIGESIPALVTFAALFQFASICLTESREALFLTIFRGGG